MIEKKAVPQIKGDFLLGSLRFYKQDPFQAMRLWQQQYGDIVGFKLGFQQLYLFNHPHLIEQSLIQQKDVFVKMYDPGKPVGLALVLGQGLVTSQGDLWRRQRRLMQPVFQRSNIAHMYPLMQQVGENLAQRWGQLDGRKNVNLANEMMRLTLEVITRTMFSASVLDRIDKIAPALDIGLRYAAKTISNPFTLPRFIPTSENKQFNAALQILDDIIEEFIAERRADSNPPNDLLTMLLNSRDPDTGEAMSDRQLRDEIITIFTAGHETTANLLTWTLFLLDKNPQRLEKMRLELDQQLQGRMPEYADLQRLPYLKAVLNESMRIRPPVGILMRRVKRDCTVDGYALKSGSLVVFSIYNIHHHSQIWAQSEQFLPERFLNDDKKRFAFMPFGTGERICIGNHFAAIESQLLLALMAQRFDVKIAPDYQEKIEMAVTIRPKGGMPVSIHRR